MHGLASQMLLVHYVMMIGNQNSNLVGLRVVVGLLFLCTLQAVDRQRAGVSECMWMLMRQHIRSVRCFSECTATRTVVECAGSGT
jgi:hypothetical protein